MVGAPGGRWKDSNQGRRRTWCARYVEERGGAWSRGEMRRNEIESLDIEESTSWTLFIIDTRTDERTECM